jgi:hypothetical protein
MIRFACPVCRAVLAVPDNAIGKKGPCPKCGQRVQIPAPRRITALGEPLPESSLIPTNPSPEEYEPRPRWWQGMRPSAWGVLALFIGLPTVGVLTIATIAVSVVNRSENVEEPGSSQSAPDRPGGLDRLDRALADRWRQIKNRVELDAVHGKRDKLLTVRGTVLRIMATSFEDIFSMGKKKDEAAAPGNPADGRSPTVVLRLSNGKSVFCIFHDSVLADPLHDIRQGDTVTIQGLDEFDLSRDNSTWLTYCRLLSHDRR